MKIIISLVCLFGFHFGVFAQSALELKGYYGVSSTQLARKVDLVGTGGVQMNNLNEFGFLLSKSVSEKFRLTGGLDIPTVKSDINLLFVLIVERNIIQVEFLILNCCHFPFMQNIR